MYSPFFLRGLVIGIFIAAPVGPIGILCIRHSLSQGQLSGFISGLGAATADGVSGDQMELSPLKEVAIRCILMRADDFRAGCIVDLITLHVFSSRPEAERAQDFLTSKGIISYVFADDCGGARPFLGFTTGGFKLQTHQNDCEAAREHLHNIMDLP